MQNNYYVGNVVVIQLDFFHEMSETEELKEEIRQLRVSHEKIRKSLYARHGELAKRYVDLHNRMQILEHNICRNKFEIRTIENV